MSGSMHRPRAQVDESESIDDGRVTFEDPVSTERFRSGMAGVPPEGAEPVLVAPGDRPDAGALEHELDGLQQLLRGELSAVETYDLALESLRHPELRGALGDLRDSHDRRVTLLRERIRELGGQPSESSGVWGAFARVVQRGAELLGDAAATSALERGEDHGLETYREDLGRFAPAVRELIRRELLPAQQRSHALAGHLRHFVKAA